MAALDRARAFHRQAASDMDVFEFLGQRAQLSRFPDCHRLHYLQMATEKLAKALFMAWGRERELRRDGHGHVAFSRLPYVLGRPDVARACGYHGPRGTTTFLRALRAIQGVCRRIERLCPAVGAGDDRSPNVENPWVGRTPEGRGTWIAPADDSFALLGEHGPDATNVRQALKLVRVWLKRFDELAELGSR